MTAEHVYSQTLLRLFDSVAPMTFDSQRGKAYKGDLTIRDLCGVCNTGFSDSDAAMRAFAESHLQTAESDSAPPKTSGNLLTFWVVKTASNISRLEKKPEWWRTLSSYLRRESTNAECDVLFARWADFSPLKIATEMGMVWHLEAREALLFGLSAGGSAAIRGQLLHASAIKVGYGVFLLLVWKSEAQPNTRPSVLADLRGFGWRDVTTPDYWLGSPAFNATSCATFSMICDPTKNLQNAIAEDKLRN
jgi:hypothetical protein